MGNLSFALVLIKGQLSKIEVQVYQFAQVPHALQYYTE